ncbi:MAG: sporulation protein YqfD [Firmicutes bacterium]|nr:sporulation protein YqfD [Bacillota bacterium]
MWNEHLLHFLRGYVVLRLRTLRLQRLLQQCAQDGILVWDLQHSGHNEYTLSLSTEDFLRLRPLLQETHSQIHLVSKKGLPFLLRQWRRRWPLIAAVFAFVSTVILLSQFVWIIQISGNHTYTAAELRQLLQEAGVHPGIARWSLPQPEALADELLQRAPGLAWAEVEQDGIRLHVHVAERAERREPSLSKPRNLVAIQDGVITKMVVIRGTPMVHVGDHVTTGQVLISGVIAGSGELGQPGMPVFVAAEGEVKATTWYTGRASIPLHQMVEKATGRTFQRNWLQIGKRKLPLGPQQVPFSRYRTTRREEPLQIAALVLPVTVVHERDEEVTLESIERTAAQARQEAVDAANRAASVHVKNNEQVRNAQILRITTTGSAVEVETVVEAEIDIAAPEYFEPSALPQTPSVPQPSQQNTAP